MLGLLIGAMERGWIPDSLIRIGIRKLCAERLRSLRANADSAAYVSELGRAPVAVQTKAANEQHYELPASFFDLVLGPHRKYSCAFFEAEDAPLGQAEEAALALTMERAELADGMDILELGCGWGSLTLAMAARFPKSSITAISNSASQRAYIEEKAKRMGIPNVKVLTRDVSQMENFGGVFDRVVSLEMFEHMRNYGLLFERVARALKPGGKAFVHIFTHREYSYLFETEGEDNWMGRYFFTGGQMPSRDLFASFSKDLKITQQWEWNGAHYQRTAEAWLKNQDAHRAKIEPIFRETYGEEAGLWFHRWRVFFLAVAELFGFEDGNQWGVTHYLFERTDGERA